MSSYAQDDSGRKVSILGDDIISHCEKEVHMNTCIIPDGYRDIAI